MEGIGLGCGLAILDSERVACGKVEIEFAFSTEWRTWLCADLYLSVGRAPKPGNTFWIDAKKSHRCEGPTVAWQHDENEYVIRIVHEGWTPTDAVDIMGNRPLDQWSSLATPFLDRLERHA